MEKNKKSKKKQKILLIFLIVLLLATNYSFLDQKIQGLLNEQETGFVERVIDGDTAVINGSSVRLLGINSPEKKENYFNEAKKFLEENILNKTVTLKFGKQKKDQYNRTLAYIFIDDKNINLELVKEGLANLYFPSGKDKYYWDFKKAWLDCLSKEKNLCEKSKDNCSKCIKLKEFDYKNQRIVFENICGFDCDFNNWEIKDEGRKKFIFENFVLKSNEKVELIVGNKTNTKTILYWKGEDYVWTETGDSLFLRDKEKKLVLFENY